jgi:hypothetical protein
VGLFRLRGISWGRGGCHGLLTSSSGGHSAK